jgi:hypothetical protein
MAGVLGGLRARGPWKAIREEFGHAPPATHYGELEAAYRAICRWT